ncbi:DNA replication regulator family [hydrothermal vent metagenome]|uniref:DNA replication regulator family n=1 Tax=hydrothermal vent metagenome TaxID=652676 RepID=A0A1W1B8I6_9ZZZZ
MQKLLNWTLNTIRQDESDFSWMEEYRYDWAPLVQSTTSKIISGQTLLVITDKENHWFGDYVISKINSVEYSRPFLPIYLLESAFPNLSTINSTQDIELLEDMLDISYPNGYFIWYIGRGDHPYTKIVYRNDDNFIWMMDDEVQNSFPLRSSDSLRDIKLLQLYKLFNQTIDAVLFGELDLDS